MNAASSRFIIIGTKASFAIAGIIAISALCGCDTQKKDVAAEQPARPVKMMIVGSACDSSFHEYPAKVKANKRVKLAFQVGGQIVSFPIKAGDRVKAGDVIGELDRRDYENAYKSSVAKYKDSKSDFERQSKLVGRSIVAVSTFESKQMEYEVAEAAMKTAEKALEDTTLKAPFDGVVVGTYVDNYQNIKAQEPVISLQDIGSVELVINVPEKDVARATAGMTLDDMNSSGAFTAEFPTLDGKAFPLKIKEYESEADSNAQTFKVVMVMETPKDVNVMPGMTALVKVAGKLSAKTEEGHWIPSCAVDEGSDGTRHVWVIDSSMKARKRIVKAGAIRGFDIFISEGLSGGERIAVAGVSLIVEGMEVKELKAIDGRKLAGLDGTLK